MPKTTISFVCQECGYDSPQWLGKCPECGSWNSFREFKDKGSRINDKRIGNNYLEVKPKTLAQIDLQHIKRINTGFEELDTVLGGGIVPGAVMLLAGDPGIGKSTLLLQLALNIAQSQEYKNTNQTLHDANIMIPDSNKKVLYISGEESA